MISIGLCLIKHAFKVQFSIAHESVKKPKKPQTYVHLPLLSSSITARKTACMSAHWADVILPSLITVVAFQPGVVPSAWNCHSSTKQLSVGHLRGVCKALSTWWWNLAARHSAPESVLWGRRPLVVAPRMLLVTGFQYKPFPFYYGTLLSIAFPHWSVFLDIMVIQVSRLFYVSQS